jgi:hypothetical protein
MRAAAERIWLFFQEQSIRIEKAEEARRKAEEAEREQLVALIDADRKKKKETLQQQRDQSLRERFTFARPRSEGPEDDVHDGQQQFERVDDGLRLPGGDVAYNLRKGSIAANGKHR